MFELYGWPNGIAVLFHSQRELGLSRAEFTSICDTSIQGNDERVHARHRFIENQIIEFAQKLADAKYAGSC